MRRKHWQVATLIVLCLLGSGTQWDALQLFAWGRMFAQHARTMTVDRAVKKTFDGEMCALCRLVAKARSDQARTPATAPKLNTKLLLFAQELTPVRLYPPARANWESVKIDGATRDPGPPSTPPPRGNLA